MGKLRSREGQDLASVKARLNGPAKQETNSTAHKNVPSPWEAPGPRPAPWWRWGGQGSREPATHIWG